MLLTPVDNSAIVAALAAALDGGPAVLPLSADDPRAGELRSAMAPGEPTLPGTAVVVATSGSTGAPKGVELSATALRASAAATHERLGGPGQWLLTLPANHIAGVQVVVRSLLAGFGPVLRGTRPFADAVRSMTGPRRYTSLVPTQLVRLLDDPVGLEALCSFDAVLLGGAAAPASLVDRARAAGVRVSTTYGMSETAGGCVYDGQPLDGVRVRLSDGVISLAGPTLASGYRRDPVGTSAAFVDGWFRTTDIGELSADGTLSVSGRADFVINTGGVKVAPAAVEAVLAEQAGVAEVCVVDLPDAEWGQLVAAAVVPVDGSSPPLVDDLRAAVRARLGGPAAPRLVRFVTALPLRGPGKVDRSGVRDVLRGS
ncbi:o-succinylbenzoate--CoA ligase [Actinophytocola oryzae]|uniref:O-succinylbenzoic acid--CoA ligase n=1 Tax=Actinophytocola oryzae TaxID=502181 RepID=A0A4R7VCZ8_9PSEU|nr:o-succinylbenzoate--CoA ligase [Actinophytocola oryzae]TDV47003.1 O-succinylbenzoic acid--CoA ligase [Actinophytocola oryzae]